MRDKQPSKIIQYINSLYAEEDELLRQCSLKANESGRSGICIAPYEGKFLTLLIKLMNVRTVVEFGTFTGYSALWMARALPNEGHIYTFEKSPESASFAREQFHKSKLLNKITVIEGDAETMMSSLDDKGPFDMTFIDANKGSYLNYLNWAEKNLVKGGLVVADNTLLFGSVVEDYNPSMSVGIPRVSKKQWQVMREFNQRLGDSERYEGLLLPTVEGLSVAIKKF